MKVFYSETHRKHEPTFEVFDGGLRTPYLENPDRMDKILNALGNTDWAEVVNRQILDSTQSTQCTMRTTFIFSPHPGLNGWIQNPKIRPRFCLPPSRFGVTPKGPRLC